MSDGRASSAMAGSSPSPPSPRPRRPHGPLHHQHHHSAAAIKSAGPVSAVSMLQNSMQVLRRMEDIRLDEDDDDDLEPSRVTALVAETLGLERVDDAEVSALMRESLAVAERLAAASIMTSDAAKRRLQARSIEMGLPHDLGHGTSSDLEEYVPPRALLLYLVRMGSFSSAPRVVNPDSQDDGVRLDVDLTPRAGRPSREDVCGWCERQLGATGTPAKLLARRMVPVEGLPRPQWGNEDANTIRVMQWNVLSQALGVNNDNFVSCPEAALDWSVRRPLMLQEIASAAPDIICLQEVDHYKFLEHAMSSMGYRGLWEPKPDSPCLYLQDNNGPDGCALLWRSDRFTLLEEHRATLHVWRITSNQVVLLAVLRHEASGRELCVATTHLKARAGALMSKMRNEQGRDLMRIVAAHADGRPVILAGDFNAEPTEPVYRTVMQNPALPLASAYSKASHRQDDETLPADPVAESAAAEPPYTTWKVREEGEQCHTIDYIFYSPSAFAVNALLDFPSGEAMGPGRVPSFFYPSDHFSLCADLQLRDPRPEPRPPARGASERTK